MKTGQPVGVSFGADSYRDLLLYYATVASGGRGAPAPAIYLYSGWNVNRMADEIALDLEPRVVLGKKVKALRRSGVIPVHVYGAKDAPESLQCERAALERVLARAGSSTPVFLGIAGKQERQLAMVREVQWEPVKGGLLHVDFLRVEAAVPISVDVPLVFEGESMGAGRLGVT